MIKKSLPRDANEFSSWGRWHALVRQISASRHVVISISNLFQKKSLHQWGIVFFNIFYNVVNVTIEFHPNYPSITIYIAIIQ